MNNTILLLHCEDFKDSSTLSPKTTTNYGVNIVDNGKFKKGMSLSSNSYLLSNATIDPSRDFTIDWWEYSTGTTNADSCLCSNRNTNLTQFQQGILIGYNGTQLYTGSDAKKWDGFTGVTIKDKVDNVWVHWALVKNGTIWATYKNGVKYWNATSSVVPASPTGFIIGGWLAANTTNYIGYNAIIDEFRISDIARWTDDFQVPLRPYNLIPDLIFTQRTMSNIKFSVIYDETINKVDVFVNDTKLKTYTSNFNDLDFAIDINNNAYKTGKNEIRILITYDNSKTIDKCINHEIPIKYNASLKEVMDKFEEIGNMKFSMLDLITSTSLPNEVKEGQIVVITDIECKNIILDYQEPSNFDNLVNGDIFIRYFTENKKKIKLKGSNNISFDIFGAKQFKDGELKKVNSFIGINEEWVGMNTLEVFSHGDIQDVSGGFEYTTVGEAGGQGSVNITDNIHVSVGSYNTTFNFVMQTKNKIPISNFKTLFIEYEFFSYRNLSSLTFEVSGAKTTTKTPTNGKTTLEIDISLFSEDGYFFTRMYRAYDASYTPGCYLKIYKIWLE